MNHLELLPEARLRRGTRLINKAKKITMDRLDRLMNHLDHLVIHLDFIMVHLDHLANHLENRPKWQTKSQTPKGQESAHSTSYIELSAEAAAATEKRWSRPRYVLCLSRSNGYDIEQYTSVAVPTLDTL